MEKEGKNFKIFGWRSDLCGDAIMILPALTYFEKLYPDSYKFFHLVKKCSQMVGVLINHPLIDRIKISKNSESYDEDDYEIMKKCDIVINTRPNHSIDDWYNYYDCVSETIQMAGINLQHFNSTLTKEEKQPKLYKYFDVGLFNYDSVGYCRDGVENNRLPKNISIQPFCGYGKGLNRSPNKEFWTKLVEKIIDLDYNVYHYGFVNEPCLSNNSRYKKLTYLTFFEQIKAALDSECIITGDSGFAWILGAYSHKTVQLITNWLPNHNTNLLALAPINVNGVNIFYYKNNYPLIDDVLKQVLKIIQS